MRGGGVNARDPDHPELDMYVVYERPADYPEWFVIRRWRIQTGASPTPYGPDRIACLCETLEEARQGLLERGLFRLPRHETDDPVIVEVWI